MKTFVSGLCTSGPKGGDQTEVEEKEKRWEEEEGDRGNFREEEEGGFEKYQGEGKLGKEKEKYSKEEKYKEKKELEKEEEGKTGEGSPSSLGPATVQQQENRRTGEQATVQEEQEEEEEETGGEPTGRILCQPASGFLPKPADNQTKPVRRVMMMKMMSMILIKLCLEIEDFITFSPESDDNMDITQAASEGVVRHAQNGGTRVNLRSLTKYQPLH